MNSKIKLALTGIVTCSAGTVMAAGVHGILDDAQMMSKLGVQGVMSVMVLGLVISVIALCKFILTVMLPLKEYLIKSSGVLDQVADKMDNLHEDMKECQRGK